MATVDHETDHETEREANPDERGLGFWVALAAGTGIMAWGGWLFLDASSSAEARRGFVAWLIGIDVAHDLLLAPVVLIVGWLMARYVPARQRPPVHAGVVVSACLLALAYLPLRGTASGTGNSSIQPLDYRTSTLTALALVWAGVGAWLAARRWSDRRVGTGR